MVESRIQVCVTRPLFSGSGRNAVERLVRAQGERLVIQDYCPFPQSIEWEFGQRYLGERGSKAFLHDLMPVPYVINNDGTLSLRAATLLFTSLLDAVICAEIMAP
jgi:hypothetical protein